MFAKTLSALTLAAGLAFSSLSFGAVNPPRAAPQTAAKSALHRARAKPIVHRSAKRPAKPTAQKIQPRTSTRVAKLVRRNGARTPRVAAKAVRTTVRK